MAVLPGSSSRSGVFIADNFRDNLIIDRYDPVFSQYAGEQAQTSSKSEQRGRGHLERLSIASAN